MRDEQEGSWTSARVIAEKHIHLFRAWPTVELFTDLEVLAVRRRMSRIPRPGFPELSGPASGQSGGAGRGITDPRGASFTQCPSAGVAS